MLVHRGYNASHAYDARDYSRSAVRQEVLRLCGTKRDECSEHAHHRGTRHLLH
jgi:hypothetical protein